MKNIKIILSLMLMFCLSVTSFAAKPPHHNSHHNNHHHSHHHYSHHYNNDARNAILVLLGVTVITAVAISASKTEKPKKQEEETIQEQYDQVAKDLTLSQEQQEKVQKLFDTNRAKVIPIRDEKSLKTIELEQEKSKEKPNENVVKTLENEISNLSMKIYKITQDTKTELQTILSPEQYETMQDIQL